MILVIANDKRMTYVAQQLSEFFNVVTDDDTVDFTQVKYVVLPFKIEGDQLAKWMNQLPEDCLIFTPIMRDFLQKVTQKVIVIMDHDEIAIYNSIPTAEGTLYYVMKNTEHTIHGSNIHVIGAGRCGETLAKSLKALGAHVSISSRNPSLSARLFESGLSVVETDADILQAADIIINTVPALMLDAQQLQHVKKEVYIADIASAPGGVDFEYAQKLGLQAELLPALPGLVAPQTAAAYLANFIKRKIDDEG
ncbi:MAG: NAD(P)-binding domain-containing protein [Defluviitaleaceae bacterium]|nr:NAD(P)-binding domain-containing protein [Defluviitaleaceae bacterium]